MGQVIEAEAGLIAPSVFTLTNSKGIEVQFIDYGARLRSIKVPDRKGVFADILLGYSTLKEYLTGDPYMGAICGRVANRIRNGAFLLNNIQIQLSKNHGNHHLHGGNLGFHNKLWKVSKKIESNHLQCYKLNLLSKHGDEGYPGNLIINVWYTLTNSNEFIIEYKAFTDTPTIVNLTSHGYFNLKGEDKGNILDHFLELNADYYTPVNGELIPTGEIKNVGSKGFDLRSPRKLSDVIFSDNSPFINCKGIDHNWVLNRKGKGLIHAAILSEESSGREMRVYTTQPAIQVYTGNHFNGEYTGKSNNKYSIYSGIALEAQYFPDSQNNPAFPSIVLNPGDIYHHKTIYKFGLTEEADIKMS